MNYDWLIIDCPLSIIHFSNLAYYSFVIGAIIQILFWALIAGRLAFYKLPITKSNSQKIIQQPVSVIVCAKNEATNLQKYLPLILNQDYSHFEVIVVNDRSTDESANILQNLQKKYPILQVINLPDEKRTIKGKKYALSKGIEAAKYEILLLTDADCAPINSEWITLMQAHISEKKTVGLGYGPMTEAPSFLNIFTQWETVYTAIQYFTFALWRMPYMGVGRNLIYKKQLYKDVDGFKTHSHIASGDDDLFINQIANARNVQIILNPSTFIYSEPKTDFRSFYIQKTRHLSTASHYQLSHKILLGLLSVSLFAFHLYPFILIGLGIGVKLVILLYLTRWGFFMMNSYFILKKLKVLRLWWYLPLLDVVYLVYLVFISPAIIFRNTSKWR